PPQQPPLRRPTVAARRRWNALLRPLTPACEAFLTVQPRFRNRNCSDKITGLRLFIVAAALLFVAQPVPAQSLPASISDQQFWAMVDGFSEPGGSFASDNIISNEIAFQQVIPE